MSSTHETLKRQYRECLCAMSNLFRLETEFALLSEMKQRVVQAQMQFDKLGGQSRMDSIELCIEEIGEVNG